jgi:hypothetical protein
LLKQNNKNVPDPIAERIAAIDADLDCFGGFEEFQFWRLVVRLKRIIGVVTFLILYL